MPVSAPSFLGSLGELLMPLVYLRFLVMGGFRGSTHQAIGVSPLSFYRRRRHLAPYRPSVRRLAVFGISPLAYLLSSPLVYHLGAANAIGKL